MQQRAHSTHVARMANFAVYVASEWRVNSGGVDSPAERDVRQMAECTGCKKVREKENKSARDLTRLPTEVTQCKDFTRKGLPVQLCEYCDGDALEEALKAHQKRTSAP
jgi:hypothetical protein